MTRGVRRAPEGSVGGSAVGVRGAHRVDWLRVGAWLVALALSAAVWLAVAFAVLRAVT